MKRYLLLLVLFSFTISVYCQQITFQKTYGEASGDWGVSVQQTIDSGYVIAGSKNSGSGNSDVYLIKTDSYGDTLWTKTFGGTDEDVGRSVQQTADGGYIIAGYTSSFGAGYSDALLIKTNVNGDTLWTKTFGGTNVDAVYSVQQTSDEGYIVAGIDGFSASGDIYLIRTDSIGVMLWSKAFGGAGDFATCVKQTTDSGFIITGAKFGVSYRDVYLIKTDQNGNTIWSKTYGGSDEDFGYSVQQTTDSGYIIAGVTQSFGAGLADLYLIKTDANGDTLWSKTYGGTSYDGGTSVQQTTDGGYIITGWTQSFSSNDDVYLIKVDATGDTLWTKVIGGIASDDGRSVKQTIDGGYIITGITMSYGAGNFDVYLIKTDSLGNSGCNETSTTTIVTTPATQVTSPSTVATPTPTIVTDSSMVIGSGGIVTTLCTTVGIQSAIINPKSEISVSPNPFTSVFAVQSSEMINQIIIYDLIGEIVYQQELSSNKTSAELNLSFLQQGVYFLNVKCNGDSWTKKIVKM